MIEAKMKEQAIFKLYEKYPFLNCKNISKYIYIENIENIFLMLYVFYMKIRIM